MAKSYVLDTSAVFAFTKAEEGSDVIEDILNLADKKNVCLSFLHQFYGIVLYHLAGKSEDSAKELIILVKSLPVQRID